MPREKPIVPSIGSISQQGPSGGPSLPNSSPMMAWSGKAAVRGPLAAELLADDGVVGEGAAQMLADHPLGGLVGLGDGGAIGLGLDGDGAEARQDLAAGEVSGALCRLGDGLEVQVGHGASG
jgi:hypothetical protein